jgi:hypothetical protein
MGGRGGTSSARSAYGNGEPVSKMGARFMYHASKQSGALERNNPDIKKNSNYEKIAQSGNFSLIDKASKQELRKMSDYYEARDENLKKKVAKLGSIDKAFENQNLLKEKRAITNAVLAAREAQKKFQKRQVIDPTLGYSRTTTTYENARKRREKNFEAWWNGSSK